MVLTIQKLKALIDQCNNCQIRNARRSTSLSKLHAGVIKSYPLFECFMGMVVVKTILPLACLNDPFVECFCNGFFATVYMEFLIDILQV